MPRRFSIALLVLAVASALIATGCGQGSADTSSASSATAAATGASTTAPSSGGANSGGGTTTAAAFKKPVPGSGKGIKIGFLSIGSQEPFIVLETQGFQKFAKAVGATLDVCDTHANDSDALSCAKEFASEGVNVVLDGQLDSKASPAICNALPKVPVIAVDVNQPPCQTSFVGSSNYPSGFVGGAAAGKYFKQHFDCKVDAIVSMEVPAAGAVNAQRVNGELAGFRSICGKTSAPIKHVGTDNTADDSQRLFTNVLSTLPSAHHILVFAISDEPAVGALAAAKAQGRAGDVYISSQSAAPEIWCQVKNNPHWIAETAYFPDRYANVAIPAAITAAHKQPIPKVLSLPHVALTSANIGHYYHVTNCGS